MADEFTVPADSTVRADKIKAALASQGTIRSAGDVEKPAAPEAAAPPAPKAAPAKAAAAAAPAEPAAAGEEPDAAAEPAKVEAEARTKRAKEWAHIEKTKADIAKREREVHREREAVTKDRAELSRIQSELAELNKMRDENPKEFLKRLGKGDLRSLIKAAVDEPELTPEQRKIADLEAKIAALETRTTKTTEELQAERAEVQRRAEGEQMREYHTAQLAKVRAYIDAGSMPGLLKQPGITRQAIAREAYGYFDPEHPEESERKVLQVLRYYDQEYAKEATPEPVTQDPPERAAGAEPTAKPEAKRAPTLSNAAAASRASSPKRLSRDERIRTFSKQLRRV